MGTIGGKLSTASRAIDPIQMAGRGVGTGMGRVMPKKQQIVDKLRDVSENTVTRGLGNPQTQAKALKKSQTTAADLFERYNLYDRDPSTIAEARKANYQRYDELANNPDVKVSLAGVVKGIDDEIARLSDPINMTSEANVAMIEELTRRRQQIMDVAGARPNSTPLTGLDTVTKYRQALDKDIPRAEFALDARGTGKAGGAKKIRDLLRDTINSTDPELKRLGLDYGALKDYEKVFEASQNRANNRQLINFTKLGTAGIGGFFGGIPGAAAGFASELVANSPQTARVLSKSARGLADKLDKTPEVTMPKNAFTAVKGAYSVGKADRMLNPSRLEQSRTQGTPQTKQGVLPQDQYQQPEKPKPLVTNSSYSKVKKQPKYTVRTSKIQPYKGTAFGKNFELKKSNAN
jgi:hypothetical protein